MLEGYHHIYFGVEAWDGLLRPRQQLMSVFARNNKVLFVEGRRHLRPTLNAFRQGDLKFSELSRSGIRQISENLFIFRYPLWAPICGRFPLNQITKQIRHVALQRALRTLQISRPIVWFLRPDMVDLISDIPSAGLFLYHCEDDYTSYRKHTAARREEIEQSEKEMMSLVDMVIVVSKNLYEAKKQYNTNTYLVPNGVNYQAYAEALSDHHLPDEIRAIKRPRLGYSGHITDRLNLVLLKELAERNPEWSLIFLGKAGNFEEQAEIWRALQRLPNVHHLGPVAWSEVPYYVKGFDVGLMPYVQDRHSEHISPMKLYDYLAAGLPVVSMDIPAAREFRQHIHLVDSSHNFQQAVQFALADNSSENRQARRSIAAQHTWQARAECISTLIEAQVATKARSDEKMYRSAVSYN